MSGRHRKPTKTAVRLARAGALTVMAAAPLALTGSAMASPLAPTDRDSNDWADHHSSSRADDSDWDDDDDDSGDDDSPSFGHADYRHASDDDSPSWRSDSDDSDSSDSSSDADNSANSDSASSSDDDSPHWRYAEPHSSRSSDSTDSTPSRAHWQSGSRALPNRRHTEPVTPQAHDARWDKLAQCESTQNWDANTGNGYKGGLQFDDRTWRNYGGTEYAPTADRASRDEQIAVAKKVQQEQGWHAWPGCSHKLGYA